VRSVRGRGRVAIVVAAFVLIVAACDRGAGSSASPTSRDLATKLQDAGYCEQPKRSDQPAGRPSGYVCGRASVWAGTSERQVDRVLARSRRSVRRILCPEGGPEFRGVFVVTGRRWLAGYDVAELRRPVERLAKVLDGEVLLLSCT